MAIGLPHEIAHGSLRSDLGEQNTEEDVDYIIETVTDVVKTPALDEPGLGERQAESVGCG